MGALEFVATVLGVVISWPLAIVVLVWIFRGPLSGLISGPLSDLMSRIKSASAAGVTLEMADAQDLNAANMASTLAAALQGFEGRLGEVEAHLDPEGSSAGPSPQPPPALLEEQPWQEAEMYVEKIPRASVSQAWIELRRRINIALEGVTPSAETRGRTAVDPADTVTLRLLQGGVAAGVIEEGWVDGWQALRRVYTRALLASPTPATASRTIETAEGLARSLPEVWQAVQGLPSA